MDPRVAWTLSLRLDPGGVRLVDASGAQQQVRDQRRRARVIVERLVQPDRRGATHHIDRLVKATELLQRPGQRVQEPGVLRPGLGKRERRARALRVRQRARRHRIGLTGESGNDTVSGGSGNDRLSGSAGRDRITGSAGNDRISGGSSVDRLSGGSGNDRIFARDGVADSITCGSGRDRVNADRRDRVSRDCERVVRR